MNRRTLLTVIGFAMFVTACGSAQPAVPAAPAKIEVTYYPRPTRPAAQQPTIPVIVVKSQATTATPVTFAEGQLVEVAASTAVAPTETPAPAVAPTNPAPTDPAVIETTDPTIESVRQEVLALHNIARAEQALAPYTIDAALQQAAQAHAEWLTQKPLSELWSLGAMAHFGPNNQSYVDRISAAGYATSAQRMNENFGAFGSAQNAFHWWMNDPDGAPAHRPQILSELYTEIGIGVVKHPAGFAYVFVINYATR